LAFGFDSEAFGLDSEALVSLLVSEVFGTVALPLADSELELDESPFDDE
jgi:hypothetical protein